uniref:ATP synthase complex subunit 8 n=1 Tax=Scirtes sp. 2 ACP-2013 TaxID=1434573 RepID=A0A3G4RY74_9COLE|nr:ATP synthase F0 subunit 8 [Scirtes sp. 2 ACP-2013]
MPQMAPMSWLNLLIYFVLIFLLLNLLNYFLYMKSNKQISSFKKNKISMNWKW